MNCNFSGDLSVTFPDILTREDALANFPEILNSINSHFAARKEARPDKAGRLELIRTEMTLKAMDVCYGKPPSPLTISL